MTRDKAILRVNSLLKMTAANGATEHEERNARELAFKIIRKHRLAFDELLAPPFTRQEFEAVMVSETAREIVAVVAVAFEELAEAARIMCEALAEVGKAIEDVMIEWSDEELFMEGKRVYRAREKGSDYGKRYGEPSRALHLRKCGVHRSDTFRVRR